MQPPPPPSITPRQMNLLRIVAYMAWSDGQLAQEEVDLMLNRFSSLFATGDQQQQLQEELRDYFMQNIPLGESIPKLESQQERELVLKLGYEVIACSARTPEEPNINEDEEAAYENLKQLLNLPGDIVERIETEVKTELNNQEGIVEMMTRGLQEFMQN
ncbi:MAG: TerB family tellurite resistance protein [Okeania sp. SIO2C2]|uniref:TerB family tellurite resistance protein n=1 Tax=Okeania hirsuta TaxID=1458930 RepID=A0A3N6PCH6_9CYAN|nr:TerB family tellurite resistance protein [Okeania sp. SIO4D6]NEP42101.1 TerB family tellurite resistance protein [Okeania sp. SIO2H7]NEP74276.1 TerB family tellurite resistance protein [Okeania sp. SIO2G5]NEP85627.1 TerB family tellurite resistance protein [Okeania sp. SIO2C2]NEP95275.1 TerB family tellurite resistance protein [Okeania sp. SIO2F5]NEQ92998.1 TerB family tellurite resistance protein [Okeania sp. SIO2G4]NES92789.1 TerB family tellurite resistance protein [Okeania sp. SIO2B9]